MIAAPKPANEARRMEVVQSLACSYAPREERFDRITRSVCGLLNVPMALITVLDDDVQWLRSAQGIAATQSPRDISFCGHVVAINKPLIVNDTLKDPRFFDNPMVVGKPFVRSYAGIPLEVEPGIVVGSLCAIDTMPRQFTTTEILSLRDMADIVVSELHKQATQKLNEQLIKDATPEIREAQLDDQTGQWNRSGLLRALGQAIRHAREQSQLALVTIRVFSYDWSRNDADPLPKEEVMAIIAQHIQQRLPEEAVLSRPETDVFCVVLPGLHREDVNQLVKLITEDVVLPNVNSNAVEKSSSDRLELSLRLQCSTAWLDANAEDILNPETVLQNALMSVAAA